MYLNAPTVRDRERVPVPAHHRDAGRHLALVRQLGHHHPLGQVPGREDGRGRVDGASHGACCATTCAACTTTTPCPRRWRRTRPRS